MKYRASWSSSYVLTGILVMTNCKVTPLQTQQSTQCETNGIPEVEAIYTGEGLLIWDILIPLPTRTIAYDSIEIHGKNLCSGRLTLGDGITPAVTLNYTILDKQSIRIELPWDRPRVDNSILFRTKNSFTRLDISLLPTSDVHVARQIYINNIKKETF